MFYGWMSVAAARAIAQNKYVTVWDKILLDLNLDIDIHTYSSRVYS